MLIKQVGSSFYLSLVTILPAYSMHLSCKKALQSLIHKKIDNGFSLIELLIVGAIIAILATIAIPIYQNYALKTKFSEVIQLTNTLKVPVTLCVQDLSAAAGCSGGSYGIPANVVAGAGNFTASVVVKDGEITGTAIFGSGLNGETYILKPSYDSINGVTWAYGGSCGGVTC